MTTSLQLKDRKGFARGQSPVVDQPNPPIEAGPFRALRRTDGKIAICDTRRHCSKWTIEVTSDEGFARRRVEGLAARDLMQPKETP